MLVSAFVLVEILGWHSCSSPLSVPVVIPGPLPDEPEVSTYVV